MDTWRSPRWTWRYERDRPISNRRPACLPLACPGLVVGQAIWFWVVDNYLKRVETRKRPGRNSGPDYSLLSDEGEDALELDDLRPSSTP